MKLVTSRFKSGGLHEKHVVATWNVGNHLSAFAYRHRETKKKPVLRYKTWRFIDTRCYSYKTLLGAVLRSGVELSWIDTHHISLEPLHMLQLPIHPFCVPPVVFIHQEGPDDRSWKVTSRWISRSDSNLPVIFMRAIQWQPRDSIRYRQVLWAGWHKWNTAEREVKKGKAFYEHRWDILPSRIYISGAVYTEGRYRDLWKDNIKANLKIWE